MNHSAASANASILIPPVHMNSCSKMQSSTIQVFVR
jgi:hypothetical protein